MVFRRLSTIIAVLGIVWCLSQIGITIIIFFLFIAQKSWEFTWVWWRRGHFRHVRTHLSGKLLKSVLFFLDTDLVSCIPDYLLKILHRLWVAQALSISPSEGNQEILGMRSTRFSPQYFARPFFLRGLFSRYAWQTKRKSCCERMKTHCWMRCLFLSYRLSARNMEFWNTLIWFQMAGTLQSHLKTGTMFFLNICFQCSMLMWLMTVSSSYALIYQQFRPQSLRVYGQRRPTVTGLTEKPCFWFDCAHAFKFNNGFSPCVGRVTALANAGSSSDFFQTGSWL